MREIPGYEETGLHEHRTENIELKTDN